MHEILVEKVEQVELPYQKSAFVHTNPTQTTLLNLLDRTKWKNMRGLLDNDTTYWWDADAATHEDMVNALGLEKSEEEDDPRRLVLYNEPDNRAFMSVSRKNRHHPKIAKFDQVGSPFIVDMY